MQPDDLSYDAAWRDHAGVDAPHDGDGGQPVEVFQDCSPGRDMIAVTYDRYGPPEVLQLTDVDTPVAEAGQVRVKVLAAGVTASDQYIRSAKVQWWLVIPLRTMLGVFRPKRKIIGIVYAGLIDQVGAGVDHFQVGDAVYGMTGFDFGVYAQFKCLTPVDSPWNGCMARKPAGLTDAEAAVAAYGGLLGLQAIEKAAVGAGDRVLLYGGSGTTGPIALQICKRLGAEVTVVAGTRNQQFMLDLGADAVLDYTQPIPHDLGAPYDVFLDTVGKHRSSPLRKRLQRHLVNGGRTSSIDDDDLAMDSARLDRIRRFIEEDGVRPIVDRVWPLEDIVEAHHALTGPKCGGFAVTIPHDDSR